jgi:hypothetical protein
MIYKIINDPRLNIHGQLHPRTVRTIGKPYVCEQPYVNTRKSKLTRDVSWTKEHFIINIQNSQK